MQRRQLLLDLAAYVVAVPCLRGLEPVMQDRGPSKTDAQARSLAVPTPQQLKWQDLEFGMFIHFSPATWQNHEFDDLKTPLSEINPTKLDTDQWVNTAHALGARYIVFVAKHQGGFCMWQTDTTEYGIRNTSWKGGTGDVLAELAISCRKRGLPLCVYVGARDDHFGAGDSGLCKTPELQRKYNVLYRQQLTEVFSRYGEMAEIWFDGSTIVPVTDLIELIERNQPNAVVFQGPSASIRWVGNEDGVAPYPCWNGIRSAKARTGVATSSDADPDGDAWLPNEVDVSIRRPDWFWSTSNANKVLTVDQLISVYYRSVGRGAQLLLNIPAMRDGLLPQPDCKIAAAFGEELSRRFGKPLGATHGTGTSLLLTLDRPARIDTVVMQEEISRGERVRAYRVDGQVNG